MQNRCSPTYKTSPSMESQAFEIYVSRLALLGFIIPALLFIWLGLDLLFFKSFFNIYTAVEQPIAAIAPIVAFFLIIPLFIVWVQGRYLVNPPRMLRVDAEHVSIATGMNYTPLQIPTSALASVSVGVATPDASTLRPENIVGQGGLVLTFKKDADVPKMAATSAGLRYSFGRLVISRLYADKGLKESVEAIQSFIQ